MNFNNEKLRDIKRIIYLSHDNQKFFQQKAQKLNSTKMKQTKTISQLKISPIQSFSHCQHTFDIHFQLVFYNFQNLF